VSGFPGPEGYAEFAARERERDRETARQDVPPVERSAEFYDFSDALRMRIDILSRTKVDKMTTRDLEKTVRCLEEALRVIVRMTDEIEQLRHKARKAGTSEGQ
jgi:hypothetical protein